MLLNIPNILSPDDVAAILTSLDNAGPTIWQDGASSAFGAAEKVKKNRQCDPKNPVTVEILEKARLALLKNSAFVSATQPDTFSKLMINAYEPGMSYGNHLDAPFIRNVRTDISVTLFLTPPTSYEGGDLIMTTPFCEMAVKGEQGGVFLYPSTHLHRVTEVKAGKRIAIVGWLKSKIRHPHQREMLYDMDRVATDLQDDPRQRDAYIRLLSVKNRMLRDWAE